MKYMIIRNYTYNLSLCLHRAYVIMHLPVCRSGE